MCVREREREEKEREENDQERKNGHLFCESQCHKNSRILNRSNRQTQNAKIKKKLFLPNWEKSSRKLADR